MLPLTDNGLKYVARDKLTTGTRLQNAEQHSLATADFPTRCKDRYISRSKIGDAMRNEFVAEKRQKLRFIDSCTNYPTVVTVKQEFVKIEPTCNFFRNLEDQLPEE